MTRTLWGVGLCLCVALAPSPSRAMDLTKLIKDIRIEGAERADDNTVRFYIHSKVGQRYSVQTVQEDIRRVYALGFFDDIKIDVIEKPDGLILTFLLTEKPFVRSIIITGLAEVEESPINEKIKTKKGTYFRQDYIPWDETRIKQIYRNKGYYFTGVRTVVHKLANNQVDVEYIIDEGEKIVIGKVIFRGNRAFSDRTLQSQIETKQSNWASFVSDTGAYRKDALKTDVLRLESFYHDNGYIDVAIADPEVEIDKERGDIYVSFPITENAQYHVGEITLEGDEVYTEDELREQIRLKTGDVFNRSAFREDIFNITDLYSRRGYAFASVKPNLHVNDDTLTVDVRVKTKKGTKVYIGRITISGNDRTRDRIIRREFLLQEGELFDSTKLRRSRTRINNLAFFESVELEQKSRREEDLVDVDIKVVERQTGQFSFSAGYSSVENLVLQGQLKWTNLLGRGQVLAVTLDTSSRRSDSSISFTEPALFDRRLSGGVDLFNRQFVFDSFRSRNTGGSLRLGKGLGEFTWGRIGYKFEKNDLTVLDTDNASIFLRAQVGKRITGSIFPSVTFDSRNDPFSPTAGQKVYAFFEMAGLGGNQKFYKAIGEYTQYKSLALNFVGMFHAKIAGAGGYGGQELPIYEGFFMGGPRSLRGFDITEVGPLDENGEALGGEALLQFNLELQYPFTRFFRGVLFYDRGNVYGKNDALGNTTDDFYNLEKMRHSWGFGIHFFSPMGPISVMYGFKLDKRERESPSEFHFTVGGAF